MHISDIKLTKLSVDHYLTDGCMSLFIFLNKLLLCCFGHLGTPHYKPGSPINIFIMLFWSFGYTPHYKPGNPINIFIPHTGTTACEQHVNSMHAGTHKTCTFIRVCGNSPTGVT